MIDFRMGIFRSDVGCVYTFTLGVIWHVCNRIGRVCSFEAFEYQTGTSIDLPV